MSLNDPRWGRKGSEDDSSQKENEIKEPPKEPTKRLMKNREKPNRAETKCRAASLRTTMTEI